MASSLSEFIFATDFRRAGRLRREPAFAIDELEERRRNPVGAITSLDSRGGSE